MAQDVFTLEGGNTQVGQTIDLPIYIQDVAGTALDTDFPNDGVYGFIMKLNFNADLVDDIEFKQAGLSSTSPPLIFLDLSDEEPGVAVMVVSYLPNPVPLNLGAAGPGDHVANLSVTPSAQADGQTIVFANNDSDTIVSGFNGIPELSVANGNLTVNLGTLTVGMGGGDLPVIQTFDVSPATIPQGEQANLSWSVTDSDTVSISPHIGDVGPIGNAIVFPGETTVYTLTATNASGSVQDTVTVTVTPANTPTIHIFEVNPSTIAPGESANLAWFVSDADTVDIQPGLGNVALNGNTPVMPGETTTYTITATNASGMAQQTTTLTVSAAQPPIIQSFTVSPGTISQGNSATLFWIVDNADTVQIDQGIGLVSLSGQQNITPGATTSYTLTATNSAGAVNANLTVTVTNEPIPQILTFEAQPNQIVAGEATTLSWEVINAEVVDISSPVGRVANSGSIQLMPMETTSYIIQARNSIDEIVDANIDVIVVPKTEIVSFSVSPTQIALGESATLTWEVANADSQSLNPGGNIAASGSMQVQPEITTQYTLAATGALNQQISQDVTLTVTGAPALSLISSDLDFGTDLKQVQTQLMVNVQNRSTGPWKIYRPGSAPRRTRVKSTVKIR